MLFVSAMLMVRIPGKQGVATPCLDIRRHAFLLTTMGCSPLLKDDQFSLVCNTLTDSSKRPCSAVRVPLKLYLASPKLRDGEGEPPFDAIN